MIQITLTSTNERVTIDATFQNIHAILAAVHEALTKDEGLSNALCHAILRRG